MNHNGRGSAWKLLRASVTAFRRGLWVITAALAASVGLVTAAGAVILVDCDTPADFCTGDPCTTPDKIEITVASCVLNFGASDLVLAHPVIVPNNGTLSLTAESIEVKKKIAGQHTKAAAGDGADVTLTATTGDITVKKRIDVSGKNTTGSILLDAAGNIALQNKLFARGKRTLPLATGGVVTLQADGMVTATKKGKIDARGKKSKTAGGQVTLSGQGGVTSYQIDVRGKPGGSVVLASSAGNVTVNGQVRAVAWKNGSAGGGSITVNAAGDISGHGAMVVNGGAPGAGTIALTAGGDITDVRVLKAKGIGVPGGTVSAMASGVDIDKIEVSGSDGGVIGVTSGTADVTLGKLLARGSSGAGGTIDVDSAANATVQSVNGRGDTVGAEMRFAANGNLNLGTKSGDKFDARGTAGGVIEGQATGNLTALGKYTAATGGCIGLSAGGVLTTSGATFDGPLTGSCP